MIDCDVHPTVPTIRALTPYLDEHWRDYVVEHGLRSLEPAYYPPAQAGSASLAGVRSAVLDGLGARLAILNCLYGVQLLHNQDLASAFASALNDWVAAEWLDPEPRLRASVVVSLLEPAAAVAEIERLAGDRRFVQVLLLVRGEMPLGRRLYWPVYEACARHGFSVGIHAGGNVGTAVTPVGWPSSWIEDHAGQGQAFQSQLISLVAEGVFSKFPSLKVVLLESGVTWLPSLLWRFDKNWKGIRREVPWVDRPPSQIVRANVRFSLTPFDAPPDPAVVAGIHEQLRSDRLLLFSSDFPHTSFGSLAEAVPPGLPKAAVARMLEDNAMETYPRLDRAG